MSDIEYRDGAIEPPPGASEWDEVTEPTQGLHRQVSPYEFATDMARVKAPAAEHRVRGAGMVTTVDVYVYSELASYQGFDEWARLVEMRLIATAVDKVRGTDLA